MCGIVGQFGSISEDIGEHLLRELAYRGPDDRGDWVSQAALLVHTRLAIIDLSEAGRQPMEWRGNGCGEAPVLVCFASIYEGFGMPILEAQATGRPVLTSKLEPMSEVAGEEALKIDLLDRSTIRSGVERLLNEPVLRSDLVQKRFANVRGYTTGSIAARYAEIYREIARAK